LAGKTTFEDVEMITLVGSPHEPLRTQGCSGRALTTQPSLQQRDIETCASEAFGFLEEAPGTTGRLERLSHRSLLSYVLSDVFVEVEMDWRESAVFILVGEAVDGQRPSGYYVDGAGQRVRWHLGAAMKEGDYAEQAKVSSAAMKSSGLQAMAEQIDAHSVSLRMALPELPHLIQQLQIR
jgi:hypothetical protein